MLGANPPSSPTLVASWPYFSWITPFSVWYSSAPILNASLRVGPREEDAVRETERDKEAETNISRRDGNTKMLTRFGDDLLLERFGANRKDHELLHGKFVTCMGTSIYHIKGLKRRGDKERREERRQEEERGDKTRR